MSSLNNNSSISLELGSGGNASWEFFKDLRKILKFKGKWTNTGDDAAVFDFSSFMSFCPVSPRTATRKRGAFSFRRSPETAAGLLKIVKK